MLKRHLNRLLFVVTLILTMAVMAGWQTNPLQACAYNVRDIGFIDLDQSNYYLFGYVNNKTPKKLRDLFRQTAFAAVADSNVNVEIVNVDKYPLNPTLKYIKKLGIKSFPAAVLVNPSGRYRQVQFGTSNKDNGITCGINSTNEANTANNTRNNGGGSSDDNNTKQLQSQWWQGMHKLVWSPMREKLLAHLPDTFAIVLIVEGTDPAQNKQVLSMADTAIKAVMQGVRFLPKPAGKMPVKLVLTQNMIPREQILLWSLGINSHPQTPSVTVLFGRGQRVGPTLHGDKLKQTNIFNMLSVIGADCECGLDRRWMCGAKIPLIWPEKIQKKMTTILGFDPDNPMVKAEVSRILGVDFGNAYRQANQDITNNNNPKGNGDKDNSLDISKVPLLGYQEIEVNFDNKNNTDKKNNSQNRDNTNTSGQNSNISTNTQKDKTNTNTQNANVSTNNRNNQTDTNGQNDNLSELAQYNPITQAGANKNPTNQTTNPQSRVAAKKISNNPTTPSAKIVDNYQTNPAKRIPKPKQNFNTVGITVGILLLLILMAAVIIIVRSKS